MQWVSDFGMTLELYIHSGKNSVDRSVDYPLYKIYADEKSETQYIEVISKDSMVQIPISCLKEMISDAEKGVHSETWYDENVFDQDDT